MNPPKFVALIATHNAAEHLKDCLDSLEDADAVVIWDQKSTDDTLHIARNYDCVIRTYDKTFYEEPETIIRNKMTEYITQYFPLHHVVSMDSDEILSDGWRIVAEEIVICYNPDGIVVPYWQLMGDARYMQVGNPIERRTLIFKPGKGPHYAGDGTTRWHQTLPQMDEAAKYSTDDIQFIHLGYTGDLRRRYTYNCERGDWTDRDDVKEDFKERIAKDPFVFTQLVEPTAQKLLTSSEILRDIVVRHSKSRDVTVDPHGEHMKIKHIAYHDRKS